MLSKLILGNEIALSDSQRIVLNETQPPENSLQINCEYEPIKEHWKDFFRIRNRKVKASYRNFEGENNDFRVKYSFLEIPTEEEYSTILSPYINMNPSDLELVLNQINIVFKNLYLNDDSYNRYNSSCKNTNNQLKFIYGNKVEDYIEPDRNVSIKYLEVPFDSSHDSLFPLIPDSEKHFRVFSRLGLDNVFDYKVFLKNYPKIRNLYTTHPSENLIQIKINLYDNLLKLVKSQIDIEDTQVKTKLDTFFNSYLKKGISRDTSFLFDSGSYFDQDEWGELHMENIHGENWREEISPWKNFKTKRERREKEKRERNLEKLQKSKAKNQKRFKKQENQKA